MSRIPRVVAVGLPHHITQRGNQRRDIFTDDPTRQVYLDLLRRHAAEYHLRLLGYCLMTNHVHLIAIPLTPHSLGKALRHVHGRFAQYWNTVHHKIGHMWQNRYYSCPMEPARIWSALRYVELNPVRAAIVSHPEQYPWSSAQAHISGHDPTGLLDMLWWHENWTHGSWKSALSAEEPDASQDTIRLATFTGRPWGSHDFVHGLERDLKRRLRPRAGGRPKQIQEQNQLGLWV